jgi:hypothetical protein
VIGFANCFIFRRESTSTSSSSMSMSQQQRQLERRLAKRYSPSSQKYLALCEFLPPELSGVVLSFFRCRACLCYDLNLLNVHREWMSRKTSSFICQSCVDIFPYYCQPAVVVYQMSALGRLRVCVCFNANCERLPVFIHTYISISKTGIFDNIKFHSYRANGRWLIDKRKCDDVAFASIRVVFLRVCEWAKSVADERWVKGLEEAQEAFQQGRLYS